MNNIILFTLKYWYITYIGVPIPIFKYSIPSIVFNSRGKIIYFSYIVPTLVFSV